MLLVQSRQSGQRRRAFTLMEILVVVAIMVALAGIGGVVFMKQYEEAKVDTAALQCKTLSDVVKRYELKHGSLPANLNELLQADGASGKAYLETADSIVDPWGKQYQLDPANGKVFTTGPDGATITNK